MTAGSPVGVMAVVTVVLVAVAGWPRGLPPSTPTATGAKRSDTEVMAPGPDAVWSGTEWRPLAGAAPGSWWRRAALVAVGGAVGLLVIGPVAAVVAAVGAGVALRQRARGRQVAARSRSASALPPALDLMAVVLGSGGSVRDAVEALAELAPDPVAGAATIALARADAGHGVDHGLRWLRAELGPELHPLTGALILAHEHGGSVSGLLTRLATDAAHGRRRLGEQRARRLPVQLLAPLVVCSLPAVIVGTVVPVAVVALRRVSW